MARAGARTGRVSRVAGDGRVYVELAELAPGFEFGPVLDTVGDLEAGERVVVTALARDEDELVIIGVLDRPPSAGGGGITEEDLEAALVPYATDLDLTAALVPYATDVDLTAMDDALTALIDGKASIADLAAKADAVHTHDDRYYTETETDTLLAGVSASATAAELPTKLRAKVSSNADVVLTGTPVLDGYQTVAGDRILLIGNSPASENGLWQIPTGGGAWVRPADFDTSAKASGAIVVVERGILRGSRAYRTTFNAQSHILGSSSMPWFELSDASHTHDAGVIVSGTVAISRLPVAASGVSSATLLVRADDSRIATSAAAPTLLTNVATAGEGNNVYLRSGNVTLAVYIQTSAALSNVLTVPVGYRPPRAIRGIMSVTDGTTRRVLMGSDGTLSVEGGLTSGQLLYGTLNYAV